MSQTPYPDLPTRDRLASLFSRLAPLLQAKDAARTSALGPQGAVNAAAELEARREYSEARNALEAVPQDAPEAAALAEARQTYEAAGQALTAAKQAYEAARRPLTTRYTAAIQALQTFRSRSKAAATRGTAVEALRVKLNAAVLANQAGQPVAPALLDDYAAQLDALGATPAAPPAAPLVEPPPGPVA